MKKLLFFTALIYCALTARAQFSDAPITPNEGGIGISVISDSIITPVEPIKYYKMKAGSGAFLSGLTYGISKVKNKNFYKAPHSPNLVKVGDKIRFTFGDVPPSMLPTHYMFTPTYTIRNFSLVEFKIKKDHRELTTGEGSLWGGFDSGTKESEKVKFDVRVVEPNVYEAVVTEAEPGEYGFVFTNNGVGAYTSVFDFSVSEN